MALADQGKQKQAIAYFGKALRISQEIGDRRAKCIDLGNLANAYQDLGQPERAIHYLKQVLEISRNIDDKQQGVVYYPQNLANVYREAGQLEKAFTHYRLAFVGSRDF